MISRHLPVCKKWHNKSVGNVIFIPEPQPDIIREIAETRKRLELVLNEGATQLQIMRERCAALGETFRRVGVSHTPKQPNSVTGDLLKHLSRREIEVLGLIADGFSTKEIAFELNIAFKTAVSHRTRLMSKLGIHDTASLVRMAISAGLVSPQGN
jgi:DNA-binding NarL/FixJ family response regulator